MEANTQAASAQELVQTIEALIADKRWGDAASIAKGALELDPRNVRLSRLLAEAQEAVGLERQKREAVEELAYQLNRLQVAEQQAARAKQQKRDALEERASKQLERGKLADAEATANELIRIAPDWAESFNTRGRVLIKRKKFDQAESDFFTALRLAPDEAAYMNNIGLVLHRRGKRKEAIEWFEKAAIKNPSFAPARTNLYASTRRYLWGGAIALVISIALHAAYVGTRGGRNDQNTMLVGLGIIALIVPVLLVRYWLRKRSLDPIAQNLYAAESRRAWRRPDTRTIVRLGGFLILSVVFLTALLTNKPPLAALSVGLSVLWLHRGWTIWRFATRWLDG
jgi:tetratricopeptide (TPR) repeat protein